MMEKFLRRREPIKKLTLVSIWYRGKTAWRFVDGEVGEDGICRVPKSVLRDLTYGIPNSATYTFG